MNKLEDVSATKDNKTVPSHIAEIMRRVDDNVSKFTDSREAARPPFVEVEGSGFFERLVQPFVDLLSKL